MEEKVTVRELAERILILANKALADDALSQKEKADIVLQYTSALKDIWFL